MEEIRKQHEESNGEKQVKKVNQSDGTEEKVRKLLLRLKRLEKIRHNWVCN